MFSVHERLLGPRIRTWRRRDCRLSMIYGDSLSCFLWRASTLGGFPYSVQHMAGQDHVQVNRLMLHAPILSNTEHTQFINVSEVEWCDTFHEG